jgi:hypothetical protein
MARGIEVEPSPDHAHERAKAHPKGAVSLHHSSCVTACCVALTRALCQLRPVRFCQERERFLAKNTSLASQPNAKDFKRLIDAAIVVNDMLTVTPWNLSRSFLEVHVQRKGARGILDFLVRGPHRSLVPSVPESA